MFNGKPPVIVRYVVAKVLKSVKALQTRKKSANCFENLLLQGIASHSENFQCKLCCSVLVVVT